MGSCLPRSGDGDFFGLRRRNGAGSTSEVHCCLCYSLARLGFTYCDDWQLRRSKLFLPDDRCNTRDRQAPGAFSFFFVKVWDVILCFGRMFVWKGELCEREALKQACSAYPNGFPRTGLLDPLG